MADKTDEWVTVTCADCHKKFKVNKSQADVILHCPFCEGHRRYGTNGFLYESNSDKSNDNQKMVTVMEVHAPVREITTLRGTHKSYTYSDGWFKDMLEEIRDFFED